MAARAASPQSELLLAFWGDLRAVQYPVTEPNPEALEAVRVGLITFRETHPDALMVDVGGFAGATVTPESSYELPPLPLYKKIGVAGVNLSAGDWVCLLTAEKIKQVPPPEPVAMLSSVRLADGRRPAAVETATPVEAGGRQVILGGTAHIPPLPFFPNEAFFLGNEQNPEQALKDALKPLRDQAPDAPVILLADMPEADAAELARRLDDIDLILLSQPRQDLKPEKISGSTWIVGRPESGVLGVARLQLGEGKGIRSVAVETIDLVPARKTKGNLWTWLGLASRPPGRRILAQPAPKPIVGIDLRDPRKYLEELGFPNATLESSRCAVPEALRQRIANKKIVAFGLSDQGKRIGNLYRVHVELPNHNGNFIVNLVLDREGRIVRASTKIDPYLVLRQTLLAPILAEWEGKRPAEVKIAPEQYPGLDAQLHHLLDAFELAAEINRHCP